MSVDQLSRRGQRLDGRLLAGGAASVLLMLVLSVLGRPVNDDYWAFSSVDQDEFWGSLAWYYTEFQGNVTSWLFILLHEQQWYGVLTPLASAGSILVFFLLLAAGVWGGLTLIGVDLGQGWRKAAILCIGSVAAWLSLESVIGPNSTTALYYMPSTIVHIWPWIFSLYALGLVFRNAPLKGAVGLAVVAGFLAGSLGFVEGVLIAAATMVMAAWIRWWSQSTVQRGAAIAWVVGLSIGILVQSLSPATWGRGGGLGSEGALTTNVQAVERLLAMTETRVGGELVNLVLGVADIDVWARALVPVAVFGDLFVRVGLLAVVLLVGWWAARGMSVRLPRPELRRRLAVGSVVVVGGALGYSGSGALYAYAGRHAAGLALVVTVLAAGWAVYLQPWWIDHGRAAIVSGLVGVLILGVLAIQQVTVGWQRASEWDSALELNRQLILEGRVEELINVPYRAGLSSSGLRDHDGSQAYINWVMRVSTSW